MAARNNGRGLGPIFRLKRRLNHGVGSERLTILAATALALTGCATTQTRYVQTACITQAQYDQLQSAKPGKVHSQLNGQADHDLLPIAGRLIRVEAWGDGLLTVLGGCIDKNER